MGGAFEPLYPLGLDIGAPGVTVCLTKRPIGGSVQAARTTSVPFIVAR